MCQNGTYFMASICQRTKQPSPTSRDKYEPDIIFEKHFGLIWKRTNDIKKLLNSALSKYDILTQIEYL